MLILKSSERYGLITWNSDSDLRSGLMGKVKVGYEVSGNSVLDPPQLEDVVVLVFVHRDVLCMLQLLDALLLDSISWESYSYIFQN